MNLTHTLLRWLPADSRPGVRQRLALVMVVAPVVALNLWLTRSSSGGFDTSLVYSFAISLGIWFCSDPLRIALCRWYGAHQGPHYWCNGALTWLHMVLSFVVGYVVGTLIGDAYAGHSTWELLLISPQRFWGYGVSTLLLAMGFNLYFQQRGKAEALERQATEARLKLLESQLEPHMLFNTLANLRALIATDPPRAVLMLDRLGDYLRATLKASRTDALQGGHTLADEFARLRDYLELMAVRMGERLSYTLDLPEALARQPVPPLLLQPLVENAIRHGLEPKMSGGTVSVRARADGARGLCIEVSDTGVGMDLSVHPADSEGGGFGLAQVRERLATAFTRRSGVELVSALDRGTTVRLRLPAMMPVSVSSPPLTQENP